MKLDPEYRTRLLLWVALGCIGLFLFDRVLLEPFAHGWRTRGEQIDRLRTRVERGQTLLDRAEALQTRWAQMEQRALPPNRSAAEDRLLKAAARWARAARVTFTSFTPQWLEPDRDRAYPLLECRATLAGRLEDLVRFLYELEADDLAVKIEELQLSAQDDQGRRLSLNVRFSGLQLLAGSSDTAPSR